MFIRFLLFICAETFPSLTRNREAHTPDQLPLLTVRVGGRRPNRKCLHAYVSLYKVTVEWRRLVTEDGDVKPGPNLLPDRVSQVKSTDLSVRVAEGTAQVHALEIK